MKKPVYMLSTHGYFDVNPETGSVMTAGRPDTGGQTVYTVELARALGALGQPTFLVTRWFDPAKNELQQLGHNAWLLRLRGGDFGFVPKERIYKVLGEISDNLISFIEKDWGEMFTEARLKPPKDIMPSLFHGHYVDGGVAAIQVARHFRTPLYWTSHSLGELKRERMPGDSEELERLYRFIHRKHEELRVMNRSTAMTVTAKTEKADIRRLYGFDASSATFIPPGVDIERFHPLSPGQSDPELHGMPTSDGPIVMMGGRIAQTKGYELALAAFERMLKQVPNANLVLFGGSDNPSKEEREVIRGLDTFREQHRIARKVFFLSGIPHDHLPAYMQRADVFLMPSRHEPFGMVALEAAACGTPTIISAHSGLAGELENGRDCLIVRPEDAETFANAISSLLLNPERARAIGEQGMITINGHYSWSGIARRHLDFWQRHGAEVM